MKLYHKEQEVKFAQVNHEFICLQTTLTEAVMDQTEQQFLNDLEKKLWTSANR